MQIFTCPNCAAPVYFRNFVCGCGADLAYDPDQNVFLSGQKTCANRAEIDCNWVADGGSHLCRSCRMTDVIPDTFHDENLWLWSDAEFAKRWVLTNLARWGWFQNADPGARPKFHLLAEKTQHGHGEVMMGHAEGLITINVTESDPVERARRREHHEERLRTMIGHFRHEIAHFLFLRLTVHETFLPSFRATFGDERADYGKALDAYYANGPAPQYQASFVTRYASAHPHEDWAETVANVLHLTDILDSAAASHLQCDGMPSRRYDAYAETESEALLSQALELGLALNHVNRSMGLQDIYPFVISPTVRAKLILAHQWVSWAKHQKRQGGFRLFGG